MAQVVASPQKDPVRQFSVFADNRVGRLNELLQRLAAKDVHVMAFSQLDTSECTVIRIVVDYHETARNLLREHGYAFSEIELVAVEIETEAQFKWITAALVEAEINIHYIYPFLRRPEGRIALAASLEDNDLGAAILSTKGFRLLRQSDIAR